MRHPTIVNLRAAWAGQAKPGDWFAAPTGRAAFRVMETRQARVVCARYSRAELPAGVKLRPWPEAPPRREPPPTLRVRRQDHLQHLLRRGVISERQFIAALRFRDTIERAAPSLPVSAPITIHRPVAATAEPVHDGHLLARRSVERAIAAESAAVLTAVVVNNVSLSVFASVARIRPSRATTQLSAALSSLEAWYDRPVVGRGRGIRSCTLDGPDAS